MATVTPEDRDANSVSTTTATPRKPSLLLRILFVIAALIAVLLVVIAMQPEDYRVTRSTTMAAPQQAVFEQVNDFHKWEAWSPWAKMDPNAKNTFEGPSSGEGSKLSWDGNSDVGAGSMTIKKSEPHERVLIQLDFVRPFAGTSNVELTFKPQGDQTLVTWDMSGKNNFIGKAISLVMDCETMIGPTFEEALANIKSIVEKPAAN